MFIFVANSRSRHEQMLDTMRSFVPGYRRGSSTDEHSRAPRNRNKGKLERANREERDEEVSMFLLIGGNPATVFLSATFGNLRARKV